MNFHQLAQNFRLSARTPAQARRQYWSMVLVASTCLLVAIVHSQQAQWYYGDYQAALQFCAAPVFQLGGITAQCTQNTLASGYLAAYSAAVKAGEPYLLVGLFLGLLAFLQLCIRLLLEMQKMRLSGDAVGPSA